MRRQPPFDPPEYLAWQADPTLVREFGERPLREPERAAVIKSLTDSQLLGMYEGLLRSRLVDYALKRWVRQGVISKAWLATGEEAVTIGNVHALERGRDVVAPMIRNAGACHELGMPIEQLLHGYLGSSHSPNGGRDGHIGDPSLGILAPISHVAEMVPVITGVALTFKTRKEPRVALTWIGDGSTKTIAAHEGLNLAAVLKVPAVFVIQNNQVALGTRVDQHQAGSFEEWGKMYGMPMLVADGNNVLDVFAATRIAAERARAGGGPSLMLATTFRMGGHATHDEAEARRTFPAELFGHWGRRDPIGLYEEWLVERGFARAALADIESRVIAEVDRATDAVAAERTRVMPEPASAELPGISAGVRQPGLSERL
ncbi:MAG: thiamine pyrophosphate-dependent dehydrogenase E1 component subunit alpha [Gemmatimonadota bacterium]